MGSGPSQMANLGGWAPCFSLVNLVIPRCVSLPKNGRPPGPNLQHRHNLTDIPWRNAHILVEIVQGCVRFTRLCPKKWRINSTATVVSCCSQSPQKMQNVHSCSSLLSCFLCQLCSWANPFKKVKWRGLTHFIFTMHPLFLKGLQPPHPIGAHRWRVMNKV